MTRYEAIVEAIEKLKKAAHDLEEFLDSMPVEEAQEVINER